jgi:aminocarboxymuconate-semialdehyde decarboxylase
MMWKYQLPIWIHPFRPIDRDDYRKYFVNHVFGWPYESAAAMAYLVFDGLFERFPGTKIIIHHCGAMVPFFDQKVEGAYDASGAIHGMKDEGRGKSLLEYFKMFYADTALSGGVSGLMCGYAFFGADHLLFATDMPYDSEFGSRLVRQTIQSVKEMSISESARKLICEGNARKLLNL